MSELRALWDREVWERFGRPSREAVESLAHREHPPNYWRESWRAINEARERARRRLIEEYGFDPQTPDWLQRLLNEELRRGATDEAYLVLRVGLGPSPVVDPERFGTAAQRTRKQRDRFRAARWTYRLWNGIRWSMLETIESILPPEPKKLSPEQLREKARALNVEIARIEAQVPYAIPAMLGHYMRSPDPEEAEAAAIGLAGIVDSFFSKTTHRKRNRALSETEQLDFLPGSVRLAWEEQPPEEYIYPGTGETNFISRVEGMLAALGNEADALDDPDRKRRDADEPVNRPQKLVRKLEYLPREDALLEREELDAPRAAEVDLETREEAERQLAALRERYGMTPQQAAVWWLKEGQGKGYEEIAARLEITREHARVQYHNAKQRYEAAGF